MSSSPILVDALRTDVPESGRAELRRPLLTEVFAQVPDPRDPRGVRHRLSTILTIAQTAVSAGARTLVAIAEWADDADRKALARLGIDGSSQLRV